jgi:hypothetical protein
LCGAAMTLSETCMKVPLFRCRGASWRHNANIQSGSR